MENEYKLLVITGPSGVGKVNIFIIAYLEYFD